MKKIKVTHIINNLQIGGAEIFLLLLLTELSKNKNLELELISLEGKGPLKEEFLKLPIKYKEFKYKLFLPLFRRFDPGFRVGLIRHLKRSNPDIIHGHLRKGEDFAKLAGGLLQKKVVVTNHDLLIIPGKKEKFLNRFLTKGVAVSEPVHEHLKTKYHLPEEKITVIPNGIKIEAFESSVKKYSSEKPVFIYVGRITAGKGLEEAITGLAMLQKEHPGLEFLIYGKEVFKKDRDRLEALIKKNRWDFVELKGPTRSVPEALKKGDIFVYLSDSEGFGMSVLEALAAGKPVLATRVGAISKMVIEGENGYFVEPGNTKSVYEKAKKILESGKIEAMGQKSTKIAKSLFSIEKVAEMYYNLYLKV